MKKRVTVFFLALLIILPVLSSAELEEDELDILEIVEEIEDEKPDIISPDGSKTITITCTGDLTIGGDNYHHKGKKFYNALENNNDDISFTMANVRDIFSEDDLTLVNFEGTLTDTTYVPDNKKGNDFLFNISPKYVKVLTENSIEAVSLDNNHVMDHGDEGLDDTISTLEEAKVVYSNSTRARWDYSPYMTSRSRCSATSASIVMTSPSAVFRRFTTKSPPISHMPRNTIRS